MEITMEYYLVISTIMFFAGIYGFMTRRNMLAVLISIEFLHPVRYRNIGL